MTGSGATPEIANRIFVVGVPRSGTTLVQSLLAAHSTTTSFTETHFFDRYFKLLPGSSRALLIRNPESRLREFLVENDEAPPEAAAWFQAEGRGMLGSRPLLPLQSNSVARGLLQVLDELALRRGKTRWIEKTPRHLRYIPFLQKMSIGGPPTSFVHVIREGLEVVASLRQASRSWERPYDLEECVRRWNADVGFSLGRIESPIDQFVFYEDLTTRPAATLERLLADLGLGWEPEILERYGGASDRIITREEEAWKANVGNGIRRSGTSDRALTEEQRQLAIRSLRQDLYDRLRERALMTPPTR